MSSCCKRAGDRLQTHFAADFASEDYDEIENKIKALVSRPFMKNPAVLDAIVPVRAGLRAPATLLRRRPLNGWIGGLLHR
jgi:hypothetical protein